MVLIELLKPLTDAISSPLLEDITIDGATGIIVNITGNEIYQCMKQMKQ
jgi:cell division GTPase FtsZ